jgi:hypothetical protein
VVGGDVVGGKEHSKTLVITAPLVLMMVVVMGGVYTPLLLL